MPRRSGSARSTAASSSSAASVGCPPRRYGLGRLGDLFATALGDLVRQVVGFDGHGGCFLICRCVGLLVCLVGHGTNSTFDTFASSSTFFTEIRIRHARGCLLGRTGIGRLDGHRDEHLRRSSPVSDSTPGLTSVPTDFDFACLTTSMNGWDRFEKSS